MNKCLILASAALAILMGCSSDVAGTGGTARACATDISAGEVQAFGGPTPMRTEGITFDADGNLLVSALASEADDQLLSVTTEGTFMVVAEAESILGLEKPFEWNPCGGHRHGRASANRSRDRRVGAHRHRSRRAELRRDHPLGHDPGVG